MTVNPIQRKTRNAFLAGMLIMLLVAILIIVLLYFTVFAKTIKDNQRKGQNGIASVYRLTSSVKSGEEIKFEKIELVDLYVDDLPADYAGIAVDITSYKSKLALEEGTILCSSLLYKDEAIANSTRLMEYSMLTLPSTLKIGDYIDVRLTMPNGENYIVLSKKEVVSIQNTTIGLYLTEDEILMMSSAIIESYVMKASNLHAVQYVEAGIQNAATTTYSVNSHVYQLIQANAQKGVNIEDYSKINESYNANLRAEIEQELQEYAGTELTNIENGVNEQKETAKQLYLSGLAGY